MMDTSDKKRPGILFVSPMPPPPGGIALQSQLWVRKMRDGGWPVKVVSSSWGQARFGGCPGIVRKPVLLLLWLVFLFRVLWGLFGVRVVVVATGSWLTFFLTAEPVVYLAKRFGKRVVLWYKGGDIENFLADAGNRVVKTLVRADALVAPTGFVGRALASCRLEAAVIPNVVDEKLFGFRRRPMQPILGLVARALEEIYNNESAIRAWSILRRRFPEARLWVAGTGPLEKQLKELAEAECPGAVRFLGAVDHDRMGEIFDRCSCLINPTKIDNMPNAVLEGQAAGLPVVATRVGGTPLLIDDGQTGLLVDPDRPEQIAAAVTRLAVEPRLHERIVEAASESVRRYQWPVVGPLWEGLIEKVCSSPLQKASL